VLQQFDESVKGERKQRCWTEDRQIDQHRGSTCINNSQCCGSGLLFALRTRLLQDLTVHSASDLEFSCVMTDSTGGGELT